MWEIMKIFNPFFLADYTDHLAHVITNNADVVNAQTEELKKMNKRLGRIEKRLGIKPCPHEAQKYGGNVVQFKPRARIYGGGNNGDAA